MKKEFFKSLSDNADPVSAVLISIATLGIAWCALQAAIWGGLQTFHLAASNRADRSAQFSRSEVNETRMLDLMGYHALAQAYVLGQKRLVDFELSRYPAGYHDSLESWFGRGAARRPNVMARVPDSIVDAKLREAEEFAKASADEFAAAHEANQISDTYVLITVLFSSVLFCAGIGPKSRSRSMQKYFLLSASFILAMALVFVVASPVSLHDWRNPLSHSRHP